MMITDSETPRMQWPLARVVEAIPDIDGLVRKVKAQLSTCYLDKHGKPTKQASVLERPVQKIVVIVEAKCD